MAAELPLWPWQYRSEVRCKSCRGPQRSDVVHRARFAQDSFCSVHNPWQSRSGSTPGPCVRPESCAPTLGVRRCHLPCLESCLSHYLLRSETVDLAMSVACRRPTICTDFLAQAVTHWARRSLFCRAKSPRFRSFPNTLFEVFPIAFRYGESMILKRIFLLLGWFERIRTKRWPKRGRTELSR